MGGIMNATDAVEFILAGATAVQVGTAIFKNPYIPLQIIDGLNSYLDRHMMGSVKELKGALQL
jgi:dihydroorotate dehydrogenase (NAD+) catalytic subunit